jgi:hypothetical protein
MKEFIFITSEGDTISPTGKSVENMQVLGTANGETKNKAKENLLKENQWITDYGFNLDEILGYELHIA